MKHVADGLKYTLKWAGELTEWISFLLQILTCLEGQTFWGKWGEITHQELSVSKNRVLHESSSSFLK